MRWVARPFAAFAVSASMFSLYLTLYLQNFLGYSAIDAGLRCLPVTVGAFVLAPISGEALAKVRGRRGRRHPARGGAGP